jgi:protein-histidine pros-kinase
MSEPSLEIQRCASRDIHPGLRARKLRLLPGVAGQCAGGSPAARQDHDGSGIVLARLYQRPGQAASGTQLKYRFLPQSVPAFAATEQFNDMRKKYPDYSYKEATLNPTNPRNRAADWEADIVNTFRQTPTRLEIFGERDTPEGRSMYLARPIQIKDPACLVCHSTPDAAPRTMIDTYGSVNGFGWKVNDIIGAQVVSIPVAVPLQRANYVFKIFLVSLGAIFIFTIIMLNLMLYWFVTRRVKRLARLADEVSLGNLDAGDFRTRSHDEIGVLTEALGRMKTSMVQAIKMLEG